MAEVQTTQEWLSAATRANSTKLVALARMAGSYRYTLLR
jgi:hypothetical protein